MEFSSLERAVIERTLSQSVEGMDILRRQFATATAVDRDYTGVGFYTKISVDRSLPGAPHSKELHDVLFRGAFGQAKSAPHEVINFKLWLDDGGYLLCLEGWTSDNHWPDENEIEFVRSISVPAWEPKSIWAWPWFTRRKRVDPQLYIERYKRDHADEFPYSHDDTLPR